MFLLRNKTVELIQDGELKGPPSSEETLKDGRDPGVVWLLQSHDPSVRYFALTELVDDHPDSSEVEKTRRLIPKGSQVRTLLDDQQPDGGFGVHPYQKWTGAHWRLVSLVERPRPRYSSSKCSIAHNPAEYHRSRVFI